MESIKKTLILSIVLFGSAIGILYVIVGIQNPTLFLLYASLGGGILSLIPIRLLQTKRDFKKLDDKLKERRKNPTLPKGFNLNDRSPKESSNE